MGMTITFHKLLPLDPLGNAIENPATTSQLFPTQRSDACIVSLEHTPQHRSNCYRHCKERPEPDKSRLIERRGVKCDRETEQTQQVRT